MTECRWCGHAHAVTDLCRARRVSRRMFCFAVGAAAVAAALPKVPRAGQVSVLWKFDEGTFVEIAELSDITPPPDITGKGWHGIDHGDGVINSLFRRDAMTFPINFVRT